MDVRPASQRRLLAGSVGPERQPVRPSATEPRWFEALHVRDPRAARQRMVGQVEAGADVVVAPTWQTHRRALVAAGETRQARAWTAAAIHIGREAIEIGLERRSAAVDGVADPGVDDPVAPAGPVAPASPPRLRPAPLLAASLPAVDETPEPGMGRLVPRQAASERDYRDQAGLLADGAPDLLLVEGQSTLAEARLAVDAALDTGLPVWVALSAHADDADLPARLLDALGGLTIECLLLPGSPPVQPPPPPWGGLLDDPANGASADRWIDAGAGVLALLDGATPGRLGPVRAAIDRADETALVAARDAEERWSSHVHRAAAMAEGGAALWLVAPGERAPGAEQLPGGFDWLVVPGDEARLLPDGRFRLVVCPAATDGRTVDPGRLLDDGGILVLAGGPGATGAAGLRLMVVDRSHVPALAIMRREP